MNIQFKRSQLDEAKMLVNIYDKSFYADYVRFGACPGYGHTINQMEKSIQNNLKFTIYADEIPVGVVSLTDRKNGIYYLGCLCVIPEYQGKGIGQQAIAFIKDYLTDWHEITLETPADKEENVRFYTQKCGFDITGESQEGKVRLYHFRMVRK